MRIALDSVVVVSKDQLASSIGGETVILGLKAGRYFGVGDTAARVWQIIQQPHRVSEVCDSILAEYDIDRGTCEKDLLDLFRRMAEARLIEVQGESPA